jgi:hypothetical protein
LFVIIASSNLENQPLITLTGSEPSLPRMLHRRQSSIAFDETAAERYRFPHKEKATIVPPATWADYQGKTALRPATRQVSAPAAENDCVFLVPAADISSKASFASRTHW